MKDNESEKAKSSWQWTSNALKEALDDWQSLAAQAPRISADEKMLQDMQKLLEELKIKIDQLSQN